MPSPVRDRLSLRQWLQNQPDDKTNQILAKLTPTEVMDIARGAWWTIARPDQLPPPGDWSIWLIHSGRGWGKTRVGSEWLIDRALAFPRTESGAPTEWAAIADTIADARDIMIEGESGLLAAMDRRDLPAKYRKAPQLQIVLPQGQKIHIRGADDADVGRGWTLAGAWLDEPAKWRYPSETWAEGLAPSLRARLPSDHPRTLVTTTPKPIALLREWIKRDDGSVVVVRGATFDNAANLSTPALRELKKRYEGTRLGRQELYGELLEDVDGALWQWRDIDDGRVRDAPPLSYTVVGVDPAITVSETSDETGIVVAGLGPDDEEYVLADLSGKTAGMDAAHRVWRAYLTYRANEVVVESNQGAVWVKQVMTDAWKLLIRSGEVEERPAPVRMVRAMEGKRLRAEPAAARYEQHRVHHVGRLPELEDQMTTWLPEEEKKSPDRVDALVHALARLRAKGRRPVVVSASSVSLRDSGVPYDRMPVAAMAELPAGRTFPLALPPGRSVYSPDTRGLSAG